MYKHTLAGLMLTVACLSSTAVCAQNWNPATSDVLGGAPGKNMVTIDAPSGSSSTHALPRLSATGAPLVPGTPIISKSPGEQPAKRVATPENFTERKTLLLGRQQQQIEALQRYQSCAQSATQHSELDTCHLAFQHAQRAAAAEILKKMEERKPMLAPSH